MPKAEVKPKSRSKVVKAPSVDIPRKMNEMCDMLHELREQVKQCTAREKALKLRIETVMDAILDALEDQGNTVGSGMFINVKVAEKVQYSFTDRAKFNEYIIKHDAWDLLQSRIGTTAVDARLKNGEDIPIESYTKTVLKVTAKPKK